jgi:hypothetical protein
MATTTNYGWTTPDDTALVKDGAAAIRTLGSSVDTTTKALNPSTTLGDIEYRSSTANTNTRLGIGTTGQILTVAGGVPSWATAATPASGLTLLTNATFSAVSSYSLPANTFSATYTNYKVIIDISSFSASGTFLSRLRASGTDASTNYVNTRIYGNGTGIASDSPSSTAYFLGDVDTNTNYTAEMTLFKPNVAIKKWHISKYFAYNGTWDTAQVGGRLDNATQYDSMTILPSSGNITGRIFVYGLAI